MEVLYFFTLAVGGTAILLIFNLFLNLKKTDKVIEQVQERQEEIVKKPAKAKQTKGISLKTLKHDLKKQEVKDFKHGLLVTNLKGHIKKASSGAYSQNGKLFLSGDGEQSILLWTVKDFGKGNTMYRINTDYQPVKYVGVSPDSKAFIAALENNKTRVYKIIKKENGYKAEMVGTENPDYNPKTEIIYAKIGVQFQSGIQNGAFLFHCYRDHLVVITDLSGTVLAQTKCASPSDVGQIQLSNCGKYFGFCGDSSELRVWAIIFKSGSFSEVKRVQSLIGHSSRISSFCFSPDSTRILTLGIDGHFKVWNSDVDWIHGHVPHELFCFESPFDSIDKLVISPDNLVVAAARKSSLSLFGIAHIGQNFTFEKVFNSNIHQIEFDPQSNFVAVTGDKLVRIFENYVGWMARVTELRKTLQVASSKTHVERLQGQIEEANQNLDRLQKLL